MCIRQFLILTLILLVSFVISAQREINAQTVTDEVSEDGLQAGLSPTPKLPTDLEDIRGTPPYLNFQPGELEDREPRRLKRGEKEKFRWRNFFFDPNETAQRAESLGELLYPINRSYTFNSSLIKRCLPLLKDSMNVDITIESHGELACPYPDKSRRKRQKNSGIGIDCIRLYLINLAYDFGVKNLQVHLEVSGKPLGAYYYNTKHKQSKFYRYTGARISGKITLKKQDGVVVVFRNFSAKTELRSGWYTRTGTGAYSTAPPPAFENEYLEMYSEILEAFTEIYGREYFTSSYLNSGAYLWQGLMKRAVQNTAVKYRKQ